MRVSLYVNVYVYVCSVDLSDFCSSEAESIVVTVIIFRCRTTVDST